MTDLPRNLEAETWLLGGILNQPKAMAQHARSLLPVDFYDNKHKLIWRTFQELHNDGIPIDIGSVSARFEQTGRFDSLFGKNDYLFELAESVPSASHSDYYVELIAKASALRKLISVLHKTLAEAFTPGAEADAVISSAMELISEIASGSAHAKDEHLADTAERVLRAIEERMRAGSAMGVPTGFCELDQLAGGLRSGELVIAGARTGMGKTSFALDIALRAAEKMPVKFFSLEMAEKQLAPRALSFFSRVNLKRTVNADITEAELLSHFEAAKELRKLNIYAEFGAGMSIGELCAETHAFCARHGAGLIVIDHLHYLKTDEKKYENRNIELGKITHSLKELAKKLDIPILLLSQLNRDIDRAGGRDKSPRLSDLRDSGNIEQDADTVWFIHRPGYYDSSIDPSETEIKIAKNRSGPTGKIRLHFDISAAKFTDAKPAPADKDGYALPSGKEGLWQNP